MSSVTLKASLKKIKSAPKVFSATVLLVAAAVLGLILLIGGRPHTAIQYTLQLNTANYHLDTAVTETEREKGLGGRIGMPADHGMLFVYDEQAQRCFWMKDMRFAIDMVWLDADNRVTAIEREVTPRSYPKIYCHTGKDFLELPAGVADRNDLQIGQIVKPVRS